MARDGNTNQSQVSPSKQDTRSGVLLISKELMREEADLKHQQHEQQEEELQSQIVPERSDDSRQLDLPEGMEHLKSVIEEKCNNAELVLSFMMSNEDTTVVNRECLRRSSKTQRDIRQALLTCRSRSLSLK